MVKVYICATILLLAVCAFAQPDKEAPPQIASSNQSAADPTSAETVKVGKLDVPAEKLRPVNVPLIAPDSGIIIDGKVDEELWQTAAVFKDFYQTSPGDNIAPSKPTVVLMMYDEKHLYIAFKCWDEPGKVRATVAKRDNVFGEDNVRIWLDTYNDQRRAYILGFNPLGIQQDGIFTEGQGADFSIDIVMESKGVVLDWGWSVEVKIPFKSLRYTAGEGKLWGFNAARNIDRLNDEFDAWMPDDRNVSGFLIKHGKISGLNSIKAERTLEIVPSVTLSQTSGKKRTIPLSVAASDRFHPIFNPTGITDPGRFVHEPVKYDLGLNLKYTITSNITLDAAINPDFAEIEADAPVVTANQRFPIFFQEKRPFFLEGAEIFQSPLQPFYSRTIVDPDIATKLTGKIGKNSFGFLVASDNAPGNFSEDERNDPDPNFRPSDEFLDKNAYFAVLRLKRDVGKEHNVGFFGTARVFPRNRNFTGGFDGTFKLNSKTVMKFQALGTHSRKYFYDPFENERNYRTGNGLGYFVSVDYSTDRHGYYLEAIGRSRDYRADAGFTRRTNTNTFFGANRFSTKSRPDAPIIRLNSNQFARISLDWKGRKQSGVAGANVNLSMQGNMFLYTEAGYGFEKIYEDEFGPARVPGERRGAFFGEPQRAAHQFFWVGNFNKTFNKQISGYMFIGSIWNALDFDFGAGPVFGRVSPPYLQFLDLYFEDPDTAGDIPPIDPGKGHQFDFEAGVNYKPVDPLQISFNYTKSKLTRNDSNRDAYDTNIFSLRSTYQFTRFIFSRVRWDYDTLSRRAAGQMLFGWNPNPGTAFYVGYNDTFTYNGFSPLTGQFEPRFERNSRTFFIRASYLFRKSF
ncbi:MAG: hypothetical protein DWQ47_15090 [Acidobacteria bacterium]|nr:MAG: hypothetical protein DWQ32_02490 [Acidobacteriota bacterium]REK02611.1 MAG: hypothetical protein DWQ38_09645 [Acidobacteriota bacterium]REK13586.1 MAG: hypothetical protein DWQ43_08180 [Acidobacteriota bacterium]REK41580.1 MAG: hypothetical protein DWQ47_15090 [Acidobacteriota bacterium]